MLWINEMNFSPPSSLFFIDARLKGKAEEKNQREKKAITSVKILRQEEIISMFEFTSLQLNVIFPFFCSLVVMSMVWCVAQSESNKCLQIFLSHTFKSIWLSRVHSFFTLQRFFMSFHMYEKNPRVFMSSFKLFSLSCHATQKFLQFWN